MVAHSTVWKLREENDRLAELADSALGIARKFIVVRVPEELDKGAVIERYKAITGVQKYGMAIVLTDFHFNGSVETLKRRLSEPSQPIDTAWLLVARDEFKKHGKRKALKLWGDRKLARSIKESAGGDKSYYLRLGSAYAAANLIKQFGLTQARVFAAMKSAGVMTSCADWLGVFNKQMGEAVPA